MSESTKRILLDTTYLLPAISFSVKGIPDDIILRLMTQGHQIFISNISLFELQAVGSKYVLRGNLRKTDVIEGIRAVRHSSYNHRSY
jgi:predicted nucleic acid-binding protein